MQTRELLIALALAASVAAPSQAQQGRYGIGHAATPGQIKSWDIDVAPDGKNLPAGRATVAQGKQVYIAQCAACHGEQGQGGLGDKLVGGKGTLATPSPVKTVGSYWPYSTTLFDYIRRAMPLNAPQSLSDAEVYAVSGYVLHLNGLLDAEATVDAKVLTELKMPNRNGFVSDPRPDVHSVACLRDCPSAAAVH